MRHLYLALVMLSGSLGLFVEPVVAVDAEVGKPVENFSLRDFRGKVHSLDEFAESQLLVIAFLGNDCPLANLYAPRLERTSRQLLSKGVRFIGINSNVQDTPTRIAAYARKHGVTFPILKDPGNKVADAFGARRTPEVFLLDARRVLRYRGRIDDQYLVGAQRPKVGSRDLVVAIEELLAGKAVSTPTTDAPGCFIGRVRKVKPRGQITFSKHIAPIFNRRCVECHRDGEIGPFPLTSYKEIEGWSETIQEVVADGRMPPWFADPKYGHFVNDNRMSAEEKRLLDTWVDNGSPEGDPNDLPEPPEFVKGWRIGKPDAVYRLPQPYSVPAEGTVDYQYFLIEPDLKEDIWVTSAEARPDNSAVVHHIVMYAVSERSKGVIAKLIAQQRAGRDRSAGRDDTEGGQKSQGSRRRSLGLAGSLRQMVAIYAPGMPPWEYPEGTAMRIRKGAAFVMQMHYTPNGSPQSDRSYVGFKFARPEDVKKRIRYGMAVNTRLRIPPHDDNYRATASYTFRDDTLLLNLFPHMHYRGKSFRFEAVYPDGSREVLLNVPRYDFNWQLRYDLSEPKRLPKGTTLQCTAYLDNSENNVLNPDPTQTVRFGLQSWDEMVVGYFTTVPTDEDGD